MKMLPPYTNHQTMEDAGYADVRCLVCNKTEFWLWRGARQETYKYVAVCRECGTYKRFVGKYEQARLV